MTEFTSDDKEFWRAGIASFLASNDGNKMYETLRDSIIELQEKAIEINSVTIPIAAPDHTILIADMIKYGYTADELLPLLKERALELFDKGNTIYLLYPDNTEVMVFERDEIEQFNGIFGIDKIDWEKAHINNDNENEKILES